MGFLSGLLSAVTGGLSDAIGGVCQMLFGGLDEAQAGLSQQMKIVSQQADIMKSILQETDEIWRGKGAEAFKRELGSQMLPGVGKIGDGIDTYSKNLDAARDRMIKADQDSHSRVNAWKDEHCSRIYG